jgi:uncharacterized protein YndB with AHSA1/START domain
MAELVHRFETRLPAPMARVFGALTSKADLEAWFAERVEIDPRQGGALRCSGRGLAAPLDTVLAIVEPPSHIAFRFPMGGAIGDVGLTLTAAPDDPTATAVAVEHVFQFAPRIPRAKELVDDSWRLALGNLSAHLSGFCPPVLQDFADPYPCVRCATVISAPPAAVFRALVEPALLQKWIAAQATVEPRVGGRYSFGWAYEMNGQKVLGGPTRVLDWVDGQRLAFDWPDWRGDKTVPTQRVTITLAPEGAGTRLSLLHDGFTRASDVSDFPFGWPWFLSRLKDVAEGEDVTPLSAAAL